MANTRNLKNGEKELLSQVFVKTLPFDKIIITDKVGIGGSFYTMPMLFNKNYHVNVGDYYNEDMSTHSDFSRTLLVHECVHVWQGVHGIFEWDYILNSVTCQLIEGRDDAYDYSVGKEWMWYGAEKQAQIVEDWYNEGMSITSNKWRYIRDNLRKPGFGGKAYFFKSARYLRWTIGEGADSGYPKGTSSKWNSFVQDSRASFSRIQGEHEYYYFFKGDEYIKWKSGSGCLDGYPKKIKDGWKCGFIYNGIDAALNIDTNKVYFFKGDKFITYTFGVDGVRAFVVRKISEVFMSSFIKDGFDMCLYWGNGKAYFFKGDQYIRYTIGDGVDSGYPKKIGDTWHSFMRNGLISGLLKHADVF